MTTDTGAGSLVITNIRNRLDASRKAKGYQERCFVDVPSHELEALLNQLASARDALQACMAYMPGSEVRNWPPGWELRKTAITKAKEALRDRGQGEAKP